MEDEFEVFPPCLDLSVGRKLGGADYLSLTGTILWPALRVLYGQ